ncbi:MmcQ/YjbR family DNA-binding protein [Polyangium sp. y55x31]|uniref:MmcQ/YjbR family DNA-binding protein n=1 Tax=Polyangium sp. y55x31 TaxID=3042688 RepID=UPI002482183E|nr:MmcQ/YjbR family DNA-binding protein [Polyangium sp. y55x31]MDI1482275.1 MmcQ/YjbR family DNA-binding protein [Polyangium sp. y55x31]
MASTKAGTKKSTKTTTKKAATKKATATAKKAAPPAKKAARGKSKMQGPGGTLERFRAICMGFPEATEVEAWGHPTFRVRDKIFAAIGGENGVWSFGVKTTFEMQAGLVATDPRFTIAKYVGKHGWVDVRIDEANDGPLDWNEVRALVAGSYKMIAPKALAARVDD